MDKHAREQYLDRVRLEYKQADKRQKGCLLDEAGRRTGLNRKVLVRKLGGRKPKKRKQARRSRSAVYNEVVVSALIRVWEIFDYPCGQRLAPILRREGARLRRLGELRCSSEVADKLGRISPKSIDRALAKEKRVRALRRNRNPAIHGVLYQKIPVKVAAEWDTGNVGNLQIDYVAHCGRSSGGDYVHTLSAVDIATGWWEGQAIAGRSQHATKEGLDRIRRRLPFRILEVHPDNDSGMINDLLWRYCRQARIAMSRSRPYKKNDNAWVEQKNWTHVRKVVGYQRFENTSEMRLVNAIYEQMRLYKNFLQPVMKLREKVREGGRIRRHYDEPQTPYERLLASGQIETAKKKELQAIYAGLNPAELHRRIESLRAELFALAETKAPGSPVRRHGPGLWAGRSAVA